MIDLWPLPRGCYSRLENFIRTLLLGVLIASFVWGAVLFWVIK